MSYFDNFLTANQAYVALHGDLRLPIKPKTQVAIVTCMDSRLHVAPALGLALGDAHILRNAGGRVTDDMIRSLVISQQQMGTREIVVLHHTDCGAQTFENEAFRQEVDLLGHGGDVPALGLPVGLEAEEIVPLEHGVCPLEAGQGDFLLVFAAYVQKDAQLGQLL